MDDIWVFGYGSLIWRVDFPFDEKRPAYIEGWARRFWQGSTDHRGVPGAPGRVVTLVEEPGARCWGMAYRLHGETFQQALDHLDYREKGGYERLALKILFDDGSYVSGITYHATADNPNYLGEAHDRDIARQVVQSAGPSGHNVEYVLQLERSLREMNATDEHVFDIALQIRALT